MRWLLLCALLLACGPAEASWRVHQTQVRWGLIQPAQPPLSASWVNDRLIVTSGPGCLYLVGNGRPSQWIGCDLPTYTLYPYGDAQYVPMRRVLVLVNGQEQTRMDVPSRVVVWMPLIANAPQE